MEAEVLVLRIWIPIYKREYDICDEEIQYIIKEKTARDKIPIFRSMAKRDLS